jgi:hypothetical protein
MFVVFAWEVVPAGGMSDKVAVFETCNEAEDFVLKKLSPLWSYQIVDILNHFQITSESENGIFEIETLQEIQYN